MTRGLGIAAFSGLALLAAWGCRKKALPATSTSTSTSSSATVPVTSPAQLHGSESRPFATTALDVFEPLKGVPSPSELAKYPLGDADRVANLSLPIDWRQDPYSSRAWSMRLNAWQFLPPALLGYETSHDKKLLRFGVDIALDWVSSYPSPRGGKKNEFAWYDMAVASRAAMLGYLVRAGDNGGVLKPDERDRLVDAALNHGKWLAKASNYKKKHNHGLFSDTGLLMLCVQLDRLPECKEWRTLARKRFRENLGATVSASGVHLEHSPSYHYLIIKLLEHRLPIDDDAEVRATLELMKQAAPWLVQPDGRWPQLGDTFDAAGPAWVSEASEKLDGARFFEDAGYYSVKTPGAQLLVVGAHNVRTHKHQDDLSFVLSTAKRRLLVDSGFLSYDSSPERDFLVSTRAHNVFVADGEYVEPKSLPSNSLRAAGEAEGWYAVAGDDTHIAAGRQHERVWLYHPGDVLLIVDRYEGDAASRSVSRYFHVAPDLQTTPSKGGVKITGGDFHAELFDASATPSEVTVEKGVRKPPFQGIVSQDEDVLLDAPAVEMRTSVGGSKSVALLSVLELGERASRRTFRLLDVAPGKLGILVGERRLGVTRKDHDLSLQVSKAGK
ncbi:MAG: alginate lyase family protein [Myxococcales bacterium]